MTEVSAGKDTTTGHWELAGVVLDQPFPTYPNGFPADLMAQYEARIGRGTLGNYPASGTEIIKELGEEHVRTGKPIVYTSADSVFQVATHEEIIPIDELYHLCEVARDLLIGEHAVGRVIARPFVGRPGNFARTERRNLINASVNAETVRCFVFTSSIAVYGNNQLPMTEDLIPAPEDSYGIAKYAVEQELRISHEMFGLPYIVFRPHNVYGERQNIGDRYRNVISIFMNQAMRGEPFTIFGNGEQQRAFSYISDVAPLIARSIELSEAYGETFNVGGDVPYTVNRLAEVVADAMGVPLRVNYLPQRNEVVDAYASHEKVRRFFSYLIHDVPLEEGVALMATWARQHGSQEPAVFRQIEVWKNMPPSWLAVCEREATR